MKPEHVIHFYMHATYDLNIDIFDQYSMYSKYLMMFHHHKTVTKVSGGCVTELELYCLYLLLPLNNIAGFSVTYWCSAHA